MENSTKEDFKEALQAIASMIGRTENAKRTFAEGSSHRTLQKNRLKALNIASSLISKELTKSDAIDRYAKADLEKAIAPIASLISKSEKALDKLAQGSWQHTMLSSNLKALYIASPLLKKALSGMSDDEERTE